MRNSLYCQRLLCLSVGMATPGFPAGVTGYSELPQFDKRETDHRFYSSVRPILLVDSRGRSAFS